MRVVGGLSGVAAVWLLACCSASSSATGGIAVRMDDFKLHLTTTTAPPGQVKLRLDNSGPSTHEINVDRTDLAAKDLPIRADGLAVDEKSSLLTRMGSIEVVEAGDKATLTLDLPPGHYVLYCNLEGHYLGEMYANLDVR
ncbi:MAG: cupredoxin domain-containing protein [Ilumatobacteraceae bacterium]